jgi:hypothetical protein
MLGSDDCSETLLIRSYLIHNSLEKRERILLLHVIVEWILGNIHKMEFRVF